MTNDETNDYFGMELIYNTTESGLSNTQYYNGNISALKWKGYGTTGTADQRSYKYNYDKSDRLKTATFQAHTGTAWTKEAGTLNESMTYDHNGNIKALERKRNLRGNSGITITATPETFDNLTYTYQKVNGSAAENTDKMVKVEDGIAGTVGQSGFNNAATSDTEFAYNTDGSLTADGNKGISSITYNVLGKPQVVTYSGSPTKTITYTYDAAGSKLKMSTLVNGVTTTTDYAGGFVYTNNALSFFSSPEGRIVKNGASFEYQYAIADHQGNTRVVFSSVTPAPEAKTATMEASTNTDFLNYTNRVGFNLFDHTDAGTTFTYAQKLTGGNNAQVGVAKTYKVYAGDKVKIEAWAKYQNPSSTGSNIAGFAAALFAAFGVPTPAGGETGTASSALNIWGGLVAGGSGGSNPSGPKAFVNIIVFDKNYKLLDAAWEAVDPAAEQVGVSPVIAHDYMMREYTAKEEGYIFMYVSNENPTLVDVYFDDVVMTYTKSNVIQYNEYYPFGQQTANSWTRDNTTGNNFLGNGGTEYNTTSSLYDLDYRNYDPILGRMNGIDPMATKYASLSPYNFSFNDPVTFNDPSGADPYQRSDDTWWVADRRSLSGGRYTGFQGNPQGWAFANQSYELRNSYGPWDWTGMSSSDIYGPSFSMFGASVSYGGGSYSEMKADAEAVQAGRMNISDYAAKYGAAISVNQLRAIVDFANAGGQFSGGSNSMEMMLVHHGALVLTNSYGEPMQSGEVIAGATYWYYDKIELSQLKGLVGNKISRSSYGTGGGTSRFDSNWQNGLTAAVTVFGLGIEIGTHPSQKPRYWSVSDFNKAAKVGKSFASKISILGAGYSAYELYNNPSGGNGVDLFFGVVGLIPGPGTVIGGIYFGADLLTMGITGKGIGEHIDSYIWSVGPNGVPFPVVKIPGK